MSLHKTYQQSILIFCAFSLSFMTIGCSSKQIASTGQNQSSPQPSSKNQSSTEVTNPTAEDKAFPKYKHIFVIVEENKAYDQIIGNANAPNINQLAKTYGLATQFYAEVHPSEANYVAILGGSTFGIHDDDAYYCQPGSLDVFCEGSNRPGFANHTVSAKSLADQLEEKGLTWKGYFESIPKPGSKAVVAPNIIQAYYASKHNGFMNYKKVQDDPNRAEKIVGMNQLTTDLKSGNVPNYSHIIFNECHEMHGLAVCDRLQNLIKTGDAEIGKVVKQITSSHLWSAPENSAIIITWDEDSVVNTGIQGCCGYDPNSAANFGGGHIATIVITNHGHRGVTDNTPYNHYSLLRSTEDAFGIYKYLNHASDTNKGVKPMTALFATK